MKRELFLAVIVAIIIYAVFMALHDSGQLFFLNEELNTFFTGGPNVNCSSDSDCVIRRTSCQPCDCGDAVSREWYPFCPFPYGNPVLCEECPSPFHDFEVKCIDDRCIILWRD